MGAAILTSGIDLQLIGLVTCICHRFDSGARVCPKSKQPYFINIAINHYHTCSTQTLVCVQLEIMKKSVVRLILSV